MACVLITGLGMQSCKPSDATIQGEVNKVLRDNYSNISSSLNNGVVTLTGTVESQAQKDAVENAVRPVKNVKSVVNNIIVREPVSTVRVNPDQTISSNITSRLNTEGFKDLRVTVNNGEVTLSGDLKRSDLTKVMQIANEAKPSRVINNLTLK